MSISVAEHTHGSDTTGLTTINTSIITPSPNRLEIAFVYSHCATAIPNIPTLTGNGLTWVQASTAVMGGGSNFRISEFRTLGLTPSNGVLGIDFAGQAQATIVWGVVEVTNVDLSGVNGSGAVVQSIANGTNASVNNFTITLAGFSSVNNGTIGFFVELDSGATLTPGAGFTQLFQDGASGDSGFKYAIEWRQDNSTAVGMTSSNSQAWLAAASEIAATPPVGAIIGSLIPPLVWATRIRS